MDINLLPEKLKVKNKLTNNIIITNITIFIVIILLVCMSFFLNFKNDDMQNKINFLNNKINSDKYTYSENILKDINVYNKSIQLYSQYKQKNLTITKNEVMNLIKKASINGDLIKLEYNTKYLIIVTGTVENEKDLIKTIDEFLKSGYTNISIKNRTLLENNLIQYTLVINTMEE